MKHLFIPHELALLAKQKGFDEPCLNAYDSEDLSVGYFMLYDNWRKYNNKMERFVLCPIYQQIVDWLRTMKGYVITSPSVNYDGEFAASIHTKSKVIDTCFAGSYYEAYNKAIEKVLNLI